MLFFLEFIAEQLNREMRHGVRETGKRPREAYVNDMVSSIPKRFKSSDVQSELAVQLPSYGEVRRCQLTRHRTHSCIPVPDPLSIPNELRTTLRGREALDGDVNKDEPFLLYSGQGGRLLVFCAKSELAALYASEYIVCDGTFEMAPETAYQLYTLHGFVNGEALAMAWALLPNKTEQTYEELFGAVRSAFITNFGDSGCSRTFVADFEAAAIKALYAVFPTDRVKGCTFHFRQAVLRRITMEGLRCQYEDKESSCQLRDWMRLLMSMTVLPTFAVPLVWTWLRYPPSTCNVDVDTKAVALAAYFERTWIAGDFRHELWTHYDNVGPRTTNVAEGWHSSLNTHFGTPPPSLRVFLDWLQKCQYQVQLRGIQLASGKKPKQRRAAYVHVDNELWQAKTQYSFQIGHVFSCATPDSWDWSTQQFHAATHHYLRRCSYLLGCC